MKNFYCRCGARLFFDNTQCLSCLRTLGVETAELRLLAFRDDKPPTGWRRCGNAAALGCNWLVRAAATTNVCRACELNTTPFIAEGECEAERVQRGDVERAKRRLLYSLLALGLPVLPRRKAGNLGLAFALERGSEGQPVLTGHNEGVITLNLAEADPAQRENVRISLKERYRTLLGHFRHEVGHYYWYVLVQDRSPLADFRHLFGDERQDYAEALKQHYGADSNSQPGDAFISNYAASHPWEDFAETFAHYLHMVDTVETAAEQGFTKVAAVGPGAKRRFERLLDQWYELSVSLNALNQSMGLYDAYPFAISPTVAGKLRYVHDLVHSTREALAPRWYAPWKAGQLAVARSG
ncbi:MAG: hypothetical protein K0R38_5906 [Polyangiaceae bacterium]|jgi:hypothetical protein|nr:hypothetical protein [Polyangiaceae bacterium]